MNRTQANEIRASLGLAPIVVDTKAVAAKKRAQAANRAAHAQLQRDIRAKRGSKVKGK